MKALFGPVRLFGNTELRSGNIRLDNRLSVEIDGDHCVVRGGDGYRLHEMTVLAESQSPEVADFLRSMAANLQSTGRTRVLSPRYAFEPGGNMVCCPGCDCGSFSDWYRCALCDGTGQVTNQEAEAWRDDCYCGRRAA